MGDELEGRGLFVVRAALCPETDRLWPRWIFLRALGLIFFSAFYSFAFQIRGLVGAQGILPAADYLSAVQGALPPVARVWYAPSLFWINASDASLLAVVGVGLLCAV